MPKNTPKRQRHGKNLLMRDADPLIGAGAKA
jgi:hypothetical protein